MILRVSPSRLSGVVHAPPAKSVMQRLLAAALLADGDTWIHNPSEADDCTAAMGVVAGLGAEIELGETSIKVRGTGGRLQPRQPVLQTGESGLGLRLFGAVAALSASPVRLVPHGTMTSRPMQPLVDVLNRLGGEAIWANETSDAPGLSIRQGISGNVTMTAQAVQLDGGLSSQFLTGLLMALPCLEGQGTLTLHVEALTSQPYVEMTLEVLEDFGISVHADEALTRFDIPLGQTYRGGIETAIDGDWSGASALLVAGMLCADGEITVEGLAGQYTQADEAIRGALLFAGGAMSGTDAGVKVAQRPVRGFVVDLAQSPDLFPALAALAAFGKKPSVLRGIGRLHHKESDRAVVLQTEFAKAGIRIDLDAEADTMTIHPAKPGSLQAARIHPHGDHRIAMAGAILGCAGVPIEIEQAECVAKSYPAFFDDLEALGAQIDWVSKDKHKDKQ